jgi:hypothetical protein
LAKLLDAFELVGHAETMAQTARARSG